MTDPYQAQQHDLGEAVQLDNEETLAGPPGNDPLDAGWIPPDRPVAIDRDGLTADEQSEDRPLADRLAEEEPDLTEAPLSESDPRAGRLVAPDEGAHGDDEADAIAYDVGVDGGASSAEEAAMHVEPER